jgi:iron(III) transport system permease protein
MTGAARHLPRPATPAKRVRQALREHRAYPSPSAILMVVGCAVFAVVALGPLGALVVETLRALALQGAKALPRAVPIGQRWALLWRSALLALAVSAASLVLGVLIATVLGRWRTGRLGTLRWLLLGLAAVPAYVHALAWTTAAYELGSALERAGLPFVALRGSPGAWWVEVMALLPIAVGMCLLAIESVPADLVEVGRTMRSDIGVLGRITLPLAAPMLVAAGGLIFLLSALDYGVPALFQVNVYALAIFADYSATNEAVSAFMMAVPLVLVGMAVVAVSQSGLRQLARRPRRRGAVGEAPSRWPAWFTAMEAVAVLALAAHLAVPLVSLIYQVGSAHTFLLAIDAARSEIAFSFGVALTVALACLPLALAAAQPLRAGGRAGRWWGLA